MTHIRTALLGLILLVAVLALLVPIVALAALTGAVAILGCIAITLWACVLLGERFVDEGLKGYSLLEALDDSANDIIGGILVARYAFKDRRTFREWLADVSPIIVGRGVVIAFIVSTPVIFVASVFIEGYRQTKLGFADVAPDMRRVWSYGTAAY